MSPFKFQDGPALSSDEGIIVLPAGLKSKEELLAFLVQAISLPDYFGDNWDALEECLNDLSWLAEPEITLVHRDIPLQHHPPDQRTYLQILANAARDSTQLSVIFPGHFRQQVEKLLSTED